MSKKDSLSVDNDDCTLNLNETCPLPEQDCSFAFEAALESLQKRGGGRIVLSQRRTNNSLVSVSQHEYQISRPLHLISNLILELEEHVSIHVNYGFHDKGNDTSHDLLFPNWPVQNHGTPNHQPNRPRAVSIISGTHLSNVTIIGHPSNSSAIHGNGAPWWNHYAHYPFDRPYLLEFQYSHQIRLHHIQLHNAPVWNVHLFDCDTVHIQAMSIHAPEYDAPNTDGWDPNSSRHIVIEDSYYAAGDDCVAIKSGWDCFGIAYNRPAANITVRNVTCHGFSAGIALGSELSGGIENVTVQNVLFTKANKPIDIKSSKDRGGYVRNVLYENITVRGSIQRGIHIDMYHYNDSPNPDCPVHWKPQHLTRLENITIRRLDATQASYAHNERFPDEAIHVWGYPASPIVHVQLQDVAVPPTEVGWNCSNVRNSRALRVQPWPPCPGFEFDGVSVHRQEYCENSGAREFLVIVFVVFVWRTMKDVRMMRVVSETK